MAVLESGTETRNVEDLMTREVVTCPPDASLSEAAQKMWEEDLGFLVVVPRGERRPVGVLTDRDVCMAAYTQGRRLTEIPVHTAMARLVHTVGEGAVAHDVLAVMRDNRLRRVPVVDPDGGVTGVVGLGDVARDASDARDALELVGTLREVTRPRASTPTTVG